MDKPCGYCGGPVKEKTHYTGDCCRYLKGLLSVRETDCETMCNALQRIEAGEAEPRMIARRALESYSARSGGTEHE